MSPKPSPRQEPEAPAVIQADHVPRNLDKVGSRSGWKRELDHDRAFRMGHLLCKERAKVNDEAKEREIEKAIYRRDAWEKFTECWLLCQANFPGGSDYNRVRVAGVPGSFCDAQIDTKRFMRAVEANLGSRDWMLCRRVCGEGWPIAKAVTDISPSYRDSTLARFRECLDALIEAMETARRG